MDLAADCTTANEEEENDVDYGIDLDIGIDKDLMNRLYEIFHCDLSLVTFTCVVTSTVSYELTFQKSRSMYLAV
jgi:hypothetical protein